MKVLIFAVVLAGGLSACGHSAHELRGTPWIWSSHWDPGPEAQARKRAQANNVVALANDRAAADAALIILTRTEIAPASIDNATASKGTALEKAVEKRRKAKRSKRRGKRKRRR